MIAIEYDNINIYPHLTYCLYSNIYMRMQPMNRNNYAPSNNQELQGLVEQAIAFVDSSQNSTDCWTNEYPKSEFCLNAPTATTSTTSDINNIDSELLDSLTGGGGGVGMHGTNDVNGKKRRMDWDPLEMNANADIGPSEPKAPNLICNGAATNGGTLSVKDRDRRNKLANNGKLKLISKCAMCMR